MATKAYELAPEYWGRGFELSTLAAAYAENGQFDEAVRYQKKALEEDDKLIRAKDEFHKCLELYEKKQPLREDR